MTLAAVIFVTVLVNTRWLLKLPLRTYLKDDLGLSPADMAMFMAAAGFAWYLKPLFGLLSDHVPLFGTRRRHYLLLSGIGGVVVWVMAASSPRTADALLVAMIAVNMFAVLGNTVGGGLLVDNGRRYRETRRFSVVRVAAMNSAMVLAGPLGGWLAGVSLGWTCLTGAGFMVLMVGVLLVSGVNEAKAARSPLLDSMRDFIAQLRCRAIWSVGLLTFVFYIAPGYQTLLYYYQRDVLAFTVQEIGLLEALQALGGVLAAVCYPRMARRTSLRILVPAGAVLSGACVALYTAYDAFTSALILEPILGFGIYLGVIPLYELSARACPTRHEALMFAAVMGLGNAALALSEMLGTRIAGVMGLGFHEMLPVYGACTAMSAAIVLLVPKQLFEQDI